MANSTEPSERTASGFWTTGRARFMVPIAFVTYSLAYLDRSNFAIGSAGGLADDLNITSGTESLIAAMFFLGYFLFQIPGTIYAERRSIKRIIAWSMMAWGVLALLQGLAVNATMLIIVRFLLGVVEGAVLPSMVVLLSRWFTKGERGRANTYLILGNPITVMWMSAVSGELVGATNWRWMFIIEGAPAIVWGLLCLRWIVDYPRRARRIDRDEVSELEAELGQEAAAAPTRLSHAEAYKRVLRSRTVLVLSLQYFVWSIAVYGFVFWLPSIIQKASGAGIGTTGLLSAIPYLFAAIAMLVNSRLSDRAGRRMIAVWPWLIAGGVALYVSWLARGDFRVSLIFLVVSGLCLYAPYGPYFAAITENVPRQVSGAAVAAVNSCGALGSFVGTYLVGWIRGTPAGSHGAFLVMAIAGVVGGLLMFPALARPPVPDRREPSSSEFSSSE